MSSVYWGILAGTFAMVVVLFVSIGISYRMPDEPGQGEGPARSDKSPSSLPTGKHAA